MADTAVGFGCGLKLPRYFGIVHVFWFFGQHFYYYRVCGIPVFPSPCTWATARGEQGGQAPTLEKIRVGMTHPGNFKC